MPLFSRSRSSTNSAGGIKDGGQQHYQSNNSSRPSTPGSHSHSHSAPGTPRPSSSSGAPYSPSTLLANFINRKKSTTGSNSVGSPNVTSTQSYQSIVSASGRSASGSTAMAAPDAARAYLAALAARSHERHHLNGSATGTTGKSGSASSFVSSQSSSDDGLVASSISSFSEVSSIASSAGDNISNAPMHSPSSFTSSITSPSFLKRRRGNTNTSSSGKSRARALSDSLKQFASETGLGEQLVYSNDYHVPVRVSEANQLSRHPPRLANKLLPARHFDSDPSYVPPALKDDPASTRHAEFGYQNERFEYKSQYRKSTGVGTEEIEEPAHYVYITTYISYLLLIVIGHLRDFIGKRTHRKSYQHLMPYNGYAALNSDFDSFYTRRLKARIEDLFARPVTGVAGRTITCLDRISTDHYATFRFTGLTTQALNISSYNYLGFNQSKGGCADAVEEAIKTYGVSSLGNRQDAGTLDLHVHAERLVARFLGVEDTLLISQGFATNSATLPVLVSKGCLVISDEHNHASIRFGVRLSGAVVKQYKHNDMRDLEKVLRESISQGQPRTHRPWKKILLIVEGLYSMEGTLVDLPKILDLKRKFKFYLYVDEAHSIGALGPRGRGVCDYFNIDPNQVDILMGTLTKSFGAAGGYIAGSKQLIDEMRRSNHSSVYGEAHSPAVLMQIISSIVCIMGREALEVVPGLQKYLTKRMLDGTEGVDRLRRLAFNSRYLSTGLRKLGFIVYGHRDSPIVPLLMFSPGKMGSFSRLMLEKFNIVTVVVAYPATPLVSSRVRFCVSAAHTKQDIDRVLIACDVVGDILGLKLSNMRKRMSIGDIIANSRELVEAEDA